MTDQALREKLCQIRDSDHPASPWARNVVQCLDTLVLTPDDVDVLRQLGNAVAMMERVMGVAQADVPAQIIPSEIAAIFGLGGHVQDHQ